jgi:hypothetical protein
LWEALKHATDDLVSCANRGGQPKFQRANFGILVIADGQDVGSATTPLRTTQAMIEANVICGGLAFTRDSVTVGIQLFGQDAFLCDEIRRTGRTFSRILQEQTILDRVPNDMFDTIEESGATRTANGLHAIAVPRHHLYVNRSQELPDAHRRRILRELHHATAVQQRSVAANDRDGSEVSMSDPDLWIYTMRQGLDEWRVCVKGNDSTAYGGK